MKAYRIEKHGGPEVMELADLPVPEVRQGEVLVKIEAAGLNYSDIMIREGFYPEKLPMPCILGREFCGVVEKQGPGSGSLKEGQRVVGTATTGGALAEYIAVPAAGLVPCPAELSPEEGAAFLLQGLTAMHCLEIAAGVKPGEQVLVHAAAGGVGTLAVQIAVALGAKVIGTASSDEKCRLIEELGGRGVNYSEKDWVKEVLDLTGGRGADVILESVGGEVFRRSYKEALADFGRMVVFGAASGEVEKVDAIEILVSNKALVGYYLGGYFPRHLDLVASATQKLAAFIKEGKVRLIIGRVFPLEETVEAFNYIQSRRSVGKVVVRP